MYSRRGQPKPPFAGDSLVEAKCRAVEVKCSGADLALCSFGFEISRWIQRRFSLCKLADAETGSTVPGDGERTRRTVSA
jgi:hypothetical protein